MAEIFFLKSSNSWVPTFVEIRSISQRKYLECIYCYKDIKMTKTRGKTAFNNVCIILSVIIFSHV